MTRTTPVLAALGAALSLMSTPTLAAPSPLGVWIDHSGRGAVEIKPCGNALCGYVVAVKSDRDTKGCGKQIIGGAKARNGNLWSGGWIYSPERRKTFDVELKPLENGNLRVVGFAGVRLFSRTMIWKPAPADLKRCGDNEQTAAVAPAKPISAKAETSAPAPEAAPKPVATPEPAQKANTPEPETADSKTAPAADNAAAPSAAEAANEGSAANSAAAKPETSEPEAAAPTDEPAQSEDQTADIEEGEDAGPPVPREKGLDLGGLNLEKILTKTKNGKCKIDLPWVKLTVDCNTD